MKQDKISCTSNQQSALNSIAPTPPSSEEQQEMIAVPDITDTTTDNKIKNVAEVNDELLPFMLNEKREQSLVAIDGYQLKEGRLQLRYLSNSEEMQWKDF
eukprot:14675551-Ditylum_brightwellii.AAC.2